MSKCPVFTSEQLKAFDGLSSGVLITEFEDNAETRYRYSNAYFAESLGYTHEEIQELLSNNCLALIYKADQDKAYAARQEVMRGKVVDSISRQNRKDGSYLWVLAHIQLIEIDGKKGIIFFFSKIQELIGLQNELTEKNDVWNDIIKSIPIGLWVFRDDKGVRTTLSVNSTLINVANTAGKMLDHKHRDWTEAEIAMLLNQDLYAFCENEDIAIVKNMLEKCENNPMASCIFRLRGSSTGNAVYIYTTCATKKVEDDSRTYYVTFQNVTEAEKRRLELVEKQNKLYELSYYDALTGVMNRNAYNEYANLCRNNRLYNVGFAFCDLNGLKKANDTLGHIYGDKMLIQFTGIVKAYFSEKQIFRISGDEFVIICPDVDRNLFQTKMGAVIDRMREEDNLASIGFIWKSNVSDIARRAQQAEQIMYVEKQRYYESSRDTNSKHRPQMLDALLESFDNGEFVMYLQPKTAIDGSKIIGAEALARKLGPGGNIIPPYEFVPQLESNKLIPKLDFYIMEQACIFLQEQHELGNDDFAVSVNVSRVTIVENEFMDNVMNIINKYDFKRSNLDFELTESSKTMDSIRLEEYLTQLKELGIKISIDDMGTEYSTLALLILDGINWVKLDRSLVSHLDQEKDKTLLKHVINMCHELKLNVIAEGVETDEVRIELMEMGCDAYQGYLTSKPISIQEFVANFL